MLGGKSKKYFWNYSNFINSINIKEKKCKKFSKFNYINIKMCYFKFIKVNFKFYI